jgi:hypothetical protein
MQVKASAETMSAVSAILAFSIDAKDEALVKTDSIKPRQSILRFSEMSWNTQLSREVFVAISYNLHRNVPLRVSATRGLFRKL